jgi:hypothetical protein
VRIRGRSDSCLYSDSIVSGAIPYSAKVCDPNMVIFNLSIGGSHHSGCPPNRSYAGATDGGYRLGFYFTTGA